MILREWVVFYLYYALRIVIKVKHCSWVFKTYRLKLITWYLYKIVKGLLVWYFSFKYLYYLICVIVWYYWSNINIAKIAARDSDVSAILYTYQILLEIWERWKSQILYSNFVNVLQLNTHISSLYILVLVDLNCSIYHKSCLDSDLSEICKRMVSQFKFLLIVYY
jgi:hypothetical protein